MTQHLMLVPSLSCPAECSYCFGPRETGPVMSLETLEAAARWQRARADGNTLEVTFHGGEPLVPGAAFYETALPLLREALAPLDVRFAVQSNLWLLTDELCDLFAHHEVSLGTSLDGPEEINDAQRGTGYFRKTMAGIERARAHGLHVGCICTFTARSAERFREVFEFFVDKGLGFGIHAAVPPLGRPPNGYALTPEAHGQLLVDMLALYLENTDKVRIGTLDAMCRSVSAGSGGICTFGQCLGEYLAVDPDGWIYPCQRMAGEEAFRLGSVHDLPTLDDLQDTGVWRLLGDRQDRVHQSCGDCAHLAYCRGGCPYNVLTYRGGGIASDPRDPHCPAYRRAFDEIAGRALSEVFSEENLAAVTSGGADSHGLLREGELLRIMRGSPHPSEVAGRARQAAAAVGLAVDCTPEAALERLDRAGLITDPTRALGSLRALRRRLDASAKQGLLNAYIHVTDVCKLTCSHCYAAEGGTGSAMSMAVEDVSRLVRQAAHAGFSKTVITGGEPLDHPQRDALLEALALLRADARPMRIVLRTNLARALTPHLADMVLAAADEVVVSVDGDETGHDARRGQGSHARTVGNLRRLLDRSPDGDGTLGRNARPTTQVVLAATLTAAETQGAGGDAVRALGEELGVPVRFKPVLPLGRAQRLALGSSFYRSMDEGADILASDMRVASTCGLGMNLYVGSDGTCHPCYALTGPRHYQGDAVAEGLETVLARNDAYRGVTVDSNRLCRTCAVRYLCGGQCRAWGESDDPDAPPPGCAALYDRAQSVLNAALETLGVDKERWRAAGLPSPRSGARQPDTGGGDGHGSLRTT